MKGFGFRLKNLRENAGYTKTELSKLLGFSPNVYGTYEREERSPSLDTVCKLSEIFNVSVDYLICGKDDSKHNYKDNRFENILQVIQYFKKHGIHSPFIADIDSWNGLPAEAFHDL